MADIKQAAKWMQEGRLVRRPHYGTRGLSGESFPVAIRAEQGHTDEGLVAVCACHGRPKHFAIESLLADDWEIAE